VPSSENKGYLSVLNLLRGLTALVVVIWHYQHFYGGLVDFDYTRQPVFSILSIAYTRGYEAVPLFWMISGVVLTHRYLFTDTTFRGFVMARLRRLYPLHLVTLCIVAGLQQIASMRLGYEVIYLNNDLDYFIKNFFFASFWSKDAGYSFNAPIWSVSIEIPIYVVFGLFVTTSGPRRFSYFAFIALAFAAGTPWLRDQLGEFLRDEFFRCILYFGIGSALYQGLSTVKQCRWGSYLIVVVASSMLLFLRSTTYDVLLLTSIAVVALCLGVEVMPLTRVTNSLRWIGDLTYSVFLCHIPIQIAMLVAFGGYEGLEATADQSWFLGLYLVLTYGFGALAYRFIETPGRLVFVPKSTN